MKLAIGAIEKRIGPAFAPPRSVAASHDFIRRLTLRYLARPLTVSRAELALAYPPPREINYHQHPHLTASLQVNIDDHFAPVPREMVIAPELVEQAREPQVSKLFKRLFSRYTRAVAFPSSAMQPTPRTTIAAGKPQLPGFSPSTTPEPVARILRASAQETSPQSPTTDPGWGTPFTPVPAPKPFTLPISEVKRVTDEVIREIDHRIIARRERFGRR